MHLTLIFSIFLSFSALGFEPTNRTNYTENENSTTYSSVSRFTAPTNQNIHYPKEPQTPQSKTPTISNEIQEKLIQSNKNQLEVQDIKQIGSALSFAKSALIENTELAKSEFGISEKENKKNTVKEIITEENMKADPIYNSPQYRDIFYSIQDSALINQAIDYYHKGKTMTVKSRKFITQKVQISIKPIIHISSIMYNDPSYWLIFTNIGKFSHSNPIIQNIRIIQNSSNEAEFMIPITNELKDEIKKLGKNIQIRNISIQKNYIALTLHTGECFFAKDLEIATKCTPRITEIEKQIEI